MNKLRKIFVAVSLFCLLLSVGTVTAKAEGESRITVSACTAQRGGSASVSLSLEGNPEYGD